MFLDPIYKDSKVENDDSWVATDLRAFGLHRVTLAIPGMRPHTFIMLPCLFIAEEGSAWCNSRCAPPTEEELEAAGPNLLQEGPSRIAFAKPSVLHWSVVADKEHFVRRPIRGLKQRRRMVPPPPPWKAGRSSNSRYRWDRRAPRGS